MLFNSHIFLLVFLPIVFAGFFIIGRISRKSAAVWLLIASLVFYGWWSPIYITLLLASITFNYCIGVTISRALAQHKHGLARHALWLGVCSDLALLAYYKYANFFIENFDAALGLGWKIDPIILPIGISFFTFTQIAFLVDAYRGEVKETDPIHYGLFVTYFPHLVAGPILHHKEMMPQFAHRETYRLNWENIAVGASIFAIGLFKKVILADSIAPFNGPIFAAAAHGAAPSLIEAWVAALSYTFQLYFDFSGYSDMAIGLSRLFGVRLPVNFDSPYKSANIVEFWRRWHMTLSRFLRDYLYIPLGGNRKGKVRRYVNLALTMILGGLWHGAGWTFLIWGALHGLYLVINHAWQSVRARAGAGGGSSRIGTLAGTLVTFGAVVVAWVFFRAENVSSAVLILKGMAGFNGIVIQDKFVPTVRLHVGSLPIGAVIPSGLLMAFPWLAALAIVVWCFPNAQQVMANYGPTLEKVRGISRMTWKPDGKWAVGIGVLMLYAFVELGKVSEFLYFQF